MPYKDQLSGSPDHLLDLLTHPTRLGTRPGLDRVLSLLHELGNPQDGLPVIHVGGTSGKGSTATIVAAILREARYRVALHTKPHLRSVEERFVVDGLPIATADLVRLIEEAAPAARRLNPTWFEMTVALALQYFRKKEVDVAVIEVGLGGTYDGTNVVQPLVAVLTNVGLDHTEVLGDTVEEIAADKVGIIKKGCIAIAGPSQESVRAIVEARCRTVGVPLDMLGRDLRYRTRSSSDEGSVFDLVTPDQCYEALRIGLIGAHQVENTTLAIGAVQALATQGYLVPESAVRAALGEVQIPGRMEVLQRHPTIILDGAHNPDKMLALATALRELFRWRKLTAVLAFKRGHDQLASLLALAPILDRAVLTRFEATTDFGRDTAQETADIRSALQSAGANCEVIVQEPAEHAMACAMEDAEADDLICVTGSLYLVGQLRYWLMARRQESVPG